MAGPEVFQAVLTATDQMSGPLKAIAAAFKGVHAGAENAAAAAAALKPPAGFADGLAHAAREMQNVARAAKAASHEMGQMHHVGAFAVVREHFAALREHADHLHHRFEGLTESVKGLAERAAELVPAFAGLGALGSVAGIFELVHKTAESATELMKQSKIAGVATEALQQWGFAAKMVEVPQEALVQGFAKLNLVIGRAIGGKAPDALALFKHLGIALKDAQGHVRPLQEIMLQLAEAFRRTEDPEIRARMAQTLFLKSWQEMIPLMLEGRQGIEEQQRLWREYGYTLTEVDKHSLEGFQQSWIKLSTAVSGFVTEVGAKLAPVLQPIVQGMADWVAANRDWLATEIAEHAKAFGDWIAGNREAIVGGLKDIGDGAKWVGTHLGLVKDVILALVAIELASWAVKIGLAAKAVVELGLAVAAFALTPTGAVIAGIGALALAGTALYEGWKHWPEIKGWLSEYSKWWLENQPPSGEQAAPDWMFRSPFGAPPPGWRPAPPSPGMNPGAPMPGLGPGVTPGAFHPGASPAAFAAYEAWSGLPRGILDAVWAAESSRGRNMLSPRGAMGHFGFMPGTWATYGRGSPFDLNQSAQAATRYLAKLMAEFGGDTAKALAGYNWGEDRVEAAIARWGGEWYRHLPRETQGYLMRTLPMLESPGFAAPPAAAAPGVGSGAVAIHVRFEGTPPGTRVRVESRGIAAAPQVETGPMTPGALRYA